jgi:hypothetical protein
MTQETKRKKVKGLVVAVMALTSAFLFPAAQAKDKPEDSTRVYQHTYDEVFQAAQKAAERLGWSVTTADKDKGAITGNGVNDNTKNLFEAHIESVSAKPETRVTVVLKLTGLSGRGGRQYFTNQFLSELAKVLATYD